MSNKKLTNKKILPKSKTPESSSPVISGKNVQPEKINANQFYEAVMKDVSRYISFKINEELAEIRKEMHDQNILIKILRNKVISQNNEIRALGMTLAQLGICEVNLLNDFKNKIKDSISVVGSDGKVVGHVETMIYNAVFENKKEDKTIGENN